MKSWLFDCNPAEWGFGVSEELLGCKDQTIDITDDVTGDTHKTAMSHIPMYVNEVGHNRNLCLNTHSREARDRSVEYYVDIKNTIKPGETFELLTDYKTTYEATRERKGYGKRNLTGEVKSDSDEASRLKREAEERQAIIGRVKNMTVLQLFLLLEFLTEKVAAPLKKVLDGCLVGSPVSESAKLRFESITFRQVIAGIRLSWLKPLIINRVEMLKRQQQSSEVKLRKEASLSGFGNMNSKVVEEMLVSGETRCCLNMARDLDWRLLHQKDLVGASAQIQQALKREAIDEVLFEVGEALPFQMDTNIWCNLSRKCVRRACIEIAPLIRAGQLKWDGIKKIMELLSKRVTRATSAVKKAIFHNSLKGLVFHDGTDGKLTIETDQEFEFEPVFNQCCSASKGAVSALWDYKKLNIGKSLERNMSVHKNVLMAEAHNDSNSLRSMPRPVAAIKSAQNRISTKWYMVWQVLDRKSVV